MTLSIVFIRWLVRLIGLKLLGSLCVPPLWIGIILDNFRICGIWPVLSDVFSILQIILAIGLFVFFKNMTGIPSGPGDELEGILSMAMQTSLQSNWRSVLCSFGLSFEVPLSGVSGTSLD